MIDYIFIIIAKLYGSIICVIAFSILCNMRRSLIKYAAIVGSVSWLAYIYLDYIKADVILQAFLSAIVVAWISHVLARVLKAPVTIFLVPGILPLVPGGAIYNSVYNYMSNEYDLGNFYFIQTLQIAGAISMAIFIMDSVFRQTRRYIRKRKVDEKKKLINTTEGDY